MGAETRSPDGQKEMTAIRVTMTTDLRVAIEQAAKNAGMDMGAWIRNQIAAGPLQNPELAKNARPAGRPPNSPNKNRRSRTNGRKMAKAG